MLHLLVLIRFEALDGPASAAGEAMRNYAERARAAGGHVVDSDDDQLLLYLADMRWGLQSLRTLLTQARDGGFAVRAAVVQAVLARREAGAVQPAFTERTLATLLRLAAEVGRQQVVVTPKLMSLIGLCAPECVDLFASARAAPPAAPDELRRQPLLVMEA